MGRNTCAWAWQGNFKLDDFQGGVLTVFNLGMLGIDRFTAILNRQQAIPAVDRIAKRVEVREGDKIDIRPMASLALTADHRMLGVQLPHGSWRQCNMR